MSPIRWLTAANMVFITPKMPPTDITTAKKPMAQENWALVSDRLA